VAVRETRRTLYHYDLHDLALNDHVTTHTVAEKRGGVAKPTQGSKFPSLREPFDGDLSGLNAAETFAKSSSETRFTKLANGLTVASEDTHTQLSNVGLYIKSGSRFESPEEVGMARLAERLMFRTTENRSHAEVVSLLEDAGMTAESSSFVDRVELRGEFLREYAEVFLSLVSESILKPVFTTEDVQEQVQYLLEEHESQMESVHWVVQNGLHELAFARTPLAHTTPSPHLTTLTAESMLQYMRRNWTAPRMVLAGSSIDHNELVDLSRKYFANLPSMPLDGSIPSVSPIGMPLMGSWRAQYTGGMKLVQKEISQEDPDPVASFALAFQGSALSDPDVHIMFALSSLLGGGDSFSTGGPGKGIHSRLYRNILCMHGYVSHCSATIHSYSDTALMTIMADCTPNRLATTLDAVCADLVRLLVDINEEAVTRAKNSLKATIFYNLESRGIITDDIARYTLAVGRRYTAQEICDRIDSINVSTLKAYIRKVLSTPPVLVAVGPQQSLKKLPQYSKIESFFQRAISM
jgi:processing peptidase subunit alpha